MLLVLNLAEVTSSLKPLKETLQFVNITYLHFTKGMSSINASIMLSPKAWLGVLIGVIFAIHKGILRSDSYVIPNMYGFRDLMSLFCQA
ncbi:hypothetical protein M8J76_011348 [Diaphorina citri]|nr:hypothetical protein M8J76_011348 [Diaphorina citri]